jgi:hypothetical protein
VSSLKAKQEALTAKQQAYVDARLGGANKSDAYRMSYNVSKMTDKQVWEEACKLDKHPKVATRLAHLHEQAAKTVVLDRAWVLERLMRNADKAVELEDLTASNKALELLGKTEELQMFVERSKSDITTDGKPIAPILNVTVGRAKP